MRAWLENCFRARVEPVGGSVLVNLPCDLTSSPVLFVEAAIFAQHGLNIRAANRHIPILTDRDKLQTLLGIVRIAPVSILILLECDWLAALGSHGHGGGIAAVRVRDLGSCAVRPLI